MLKKRLFSVLLTVIIAICPTWVSAFQTPEDVRAVPADSYHAPYDEEGNPFVTYYAPWLRNLHLMSFREANDNKASGIPGGEAYQQVRMLEISPVDSNVMYFITDTSGIYATKDGGKHWYSVNNNVIGNYGIGLWCDRKDKDTVYASMGKYGIYRSKNGGDSWELILRDTNAEKTYRSNTITQDEDGNTYFAASSGIYRLNRDDDTLDQIYTSPDTDQKCPNWWDIEVSPDGQTIYAAATRTTALNKTPGLYVSYNGGEDWEIKVTNNTHEYNVYSIALHPDDPKKVYFTALKTTAGLQVEDEETSEDTSEEESNEEEGGTTGSGEGDHLGHCALYVSGDSGETFQAISTYKLSSGEYRNFFGLRFGPKTADDIYPLYFSAHGTACPLRVSYDYGKTSQTVYDKSDMLGAQTIRGTYDGAYGGWWYKAFAPDMNNSGRIVFSGNGIYEKSADGKFNRISGGFSGASVTDITFDSTGKPFFVTTDVGTHIADGVYKQNADGTYTYPTFSESVDDFFTMAEFNPENDNHIVAYVGTNNSNNGYYAIRQSKNGGRGFYGMIAETKIPISEGIANNTVIRFDGDNIYTSYFTGRNGGTTWTRNMCGETPIFILTASKTNPKLMVGATGNTNENCCFYRSEDGGETWIKIGNGKIGTAPDFDCAEFDVYGENGEDDGDWVWLVKRKGVYHYNIRTGSYKIINTNEGMVFDAFSQIAQNPNDPNHILLGSRPNFVTWGKDNKLSESYDGGKTWHTVPGLWSGQINEIKFVPNTTEVFIGTMAGVFIYDYEKFNYYSSVPIIIGRKTELTTLKRYNDAGENVNNGEYIIAPDYPYAIPSGKEFRGWAYKGKLYQSGEKIPIE